MSERETLKSKELDLKTDFNEILKAGYTVNLWNTGGSVRVAEILHPGAPMGDVSDKLGYGADGTAEEALVRARDSYYERERAGKPAMSQEDMRRADAGYMTGSRVTSESSYLDRVASVSEIVVHFDGDEVVATIPSLTFGESSHAQGRGINMAQALDDLEELSGGRTF